MTQFSSGRVIAAAAIAASLAAFGLVAAPQAGGVQPTTHVTTMAHRSLAHSAVLAPTAGTTCAFDGTSVRTCDLWAQVGQVPMPGITPDPTFWSFTSQQSDPVAPVGPTLVVNQGDTVHLVLHNNLGAGTMTSLDVPQQDTFIEDMQGVANGDKKDYTFTANRPGTFLYEAGGTSDGARQVAMGMVGALIVLPSTPGSAYGTLNTSYNDESVVLLTDVDPKLNANPDGFDLRNYHPTLHLLNGAAYPNTTTIPVTAGGHALLRIINGGIIQHALGVLGTDQTVVAQSSRLLSHPYGIAAENITAGDTSDVIVDVPATGGPLYPVYDASTRLDNSMAPTTGVTPFGGALTFLTTGQTPAADNTPTVTGLSLATPGTNGNTDLAFTGTAVQAAAGSAIDSAEFIIDNGGATPGDPTNYAITVSGTGSQPFSSAIPAAVLQGLSAGTHTLLVRAHSADGWGPLAAIGFVVDNAGPTAALQLDQTAINSGDLTVSGSASDAQTGGSAIASGTYSIDGQSDAAHTGTFTVSPANRVNVALDATIPAAQIAGLAEGNHTITATVTDVYGNTGPASDPVTFTVDQTGPSITTITVTPSPNSGSQGVAYDPTSVEVRASFVDTPGANGAVTGIQDGEAFLGVQGADGSGFPLYPYPRGGTNQVLLGQFPVSELTRFADGSVPVFVHARDNAGNWGPVKIGAIIISRDVILATTFDTPDPQGLVPPFANVVQSGALTGIWGTAGASGNHAFVVARPTNTTFSTADKAYLNDPSPNSETHYNVAFTFHPGDFRTGGATAGGRSATIFAGRTAGVSANTIAVEYQGYATGLAATRHIRLVVNTANGPARTGWVELTNTGTYRVHIQWVSGTSTTAVFKVDGVTPTNGLTVTAANTIAYQIDFAWLGVSSWAGGFATTVPTSGSNPMWFDNFDSRRKTAP